MTSKFDFTYRDTTGKIKNCGYMQIENKADNNELCFYGDICSSQWDKWTYDDKSPQDIVDFFAEIDDNKPLDVYINSGGGSVFGGLAIYNIISRYKGYKTAHIDGLAASIASVIPFACDKVVGSSSAMIMIHKPWASMQGDANELRKQADILDKCEELVLGIYAQHTKEGISESVIKEMLEAETWLTCDEAKNYFDIEVIETAEAVAFAKSEYYNKYSRTPSLNRSDEDQKSNKLNLQLQLDLIKLS